MCSVCVVVLWHPGVVLLGREREISSVLFQFCVCEQWFLTVQKVNTSRWILLRLFVWLQSGIGKEREPKIDNCHLRWLLVESLQQGQAGTARDCSCCLAFCSNGDMKWVSIIPNSIPRNVSRTSTLSDRIKWIKWRLRHLSLLYWQRWKMERAIYEHDCMSSIPGSTVFARMS